MGSKRKRYHNFNYRNSESGKSRHETSPNGTKRRRLSENGNDSTKMSTPIKTAVPDETKIKASKDDRNSDDEGWTTITSKHQKHKQPRRDEVKNGQLRRDELKDGQPRLRFHQSYQSHLKIKDLRDLAMYILADEIAPKWVAVADSRSIKKVVVLMLPGMDKAILERVRTSFVDGEDKNGDIGSTNGHIEEEITQPENPKSMTKPDLKTKPAQNLVASADMTKPHSSDSHWLFEHVLSVQGPGDAKTSRVHSPLQAMLLGPEREQKKSSSTYEDHSSKQTATPITQFIHNTDELREAEFPIHPATFTNQLDAEYEALRRNQTGQSLKDGWVDTAVTTSIPQANPTSSQDSISGGLSLYSIDCEMVQTSDDNHSLARVSMISYPNGEIIIDEYVKPSLPIKNYFTQFSGITPEILEPITTTLSDIQASLLKILNSSSILLGHSLDSDLNALKLTHPFLVDTSIIYPHPRGLPLRSSLKYLTSKYLKRDIQTAGASGHNSVEDAEAVLDLVRLKCIKGPKWGTIEANGEPVFRNLKSCGRSSAMVDYGTPERGLGKDATFPIGCEDDEGVVAGVLRAVKGDAFFDFEIPASGADYIWGRLRALEYARGWVNNNVNSEEKKEEEDKELEVDEIAKETILRVQRIYDALPPKSLLILFSGTGDMRPVLRLQAQQQAYKREFKVKKWDELTVKWTDVEDQALRKACGDARAGWAVCTVKS